MACGPGYQASPPSGMQVLQGNLFQWSSSQNHMEHSSGSAAFNVAPGPQQSGSGLSLPLSHMENTPTADNLHPALFDRPHLHF